MDLLLAKNNHFDSFLQRKKKRLQSLEKATVQSGQDVKSKLKETTQNPGLNNAVSLSKSLFNGATWIGKSYWRLIKPLEPSFLEKVHYLETDLAQYILHRVRNKQSISYKKATYSEIFKTLFYDFEISHLDASYESVSQVPQIDSSVLLVSGVFNEIFSTPAFDRGAKYLKEKYDIDYSFCPTSGIKSTAENSRMIKEHMDELLDKNNKTWVFAFSKGGIDFLHFLKEYDYQSNINGLSTVATPILGSDRVNHKLLQLLNKIHNFSNNKIYQFFDERFDILLKDFQESLSSDFQENWFKENFSFLPRNMFYTALALESSWYDSHVWMILTKLFFQSESINDGIVDAERALFPDYFQGMNLGILKGHHLIGTRSSDYVQEALIEAHIVFLNYMGFLR